MRIFRCGQLAADRGLLPHGSPAWKAGLRAAWAGRMLAAIAAMVLVAMGQAATAGQNAAASPAARVLPPRVMQAQRFLAQRGGPAGRRGRSVAGRGNFRTGGLRADAVGAQSAATWSALGPTAVVTPEFGLVTGRISALALDPSDATGNRVYVGTTGGGVWFAQNADASNPASVVFSPLTDAVAALSGASDASISIGALTVQPGGTGVILAGTGDPNDALDSYYGAGILRSADGGNTWSLISTTADQLWGFAGEGFAGFAWSTVTPQLVVAAVSQAYEGTLVNAKFHNRSYEGLYYSADGGATWNLARITDGAGTDVQGPSDAFASPDGNAATAVVWNPVRQIFVAAVRYHGYYQSSDGMTWTRMAVSGSNTQTVASGQAAGYTLVITPLNGSQGTFTFTCGTLPANAHCLFNPATETLGAGVTGNVSVQIATGGSGTTARLRNPGVLGLLPLACAVLVLPHGWRRRRALLLLALLAILSGGVTSCVSSEVVTGGGASGGTGGSGSGSTPAGTYTIPATVVSNGIQHSVSLTATVD
jgi:hypothetical protein